jgi:DNA-binding CsgD family transcriptional regulator
LFFKPIQAKDSFQFVKGTNGQVWSLDEINGELFCGHDYGTFLIRNDKAIRIANIQGTWSVKPVPGRDDLLLQGNYDGFNILENKDQNWTWRNKIKGFDISSRYFEFLDSETVFISHEYKGVIKIQLDSDYENVINIQEQPPFEKGLNSSLIKYNNEIFYANRNGVYKYDIKQNEFVSDTILSQLYSKDDYVSGKLISDNTNKLWNFSKFNLSYLDTGSLTDIPELITIALPDKQINNMNGFENITHLSNEEYLIGTSNGYIIMDLSKLKSNNYSIAINTAEVGGLDLDFKRTNLNKKGTFKNETNNIHFLFSIPEYFRYSEKRYQYKLEGYNNVWSDWSTDASHLFENLPYGNYTFNVRGRVGNTITTNIASYSFAIEKPWFLSNLFITIYVIAGLFMLLVIHLVYRSYYKQQREKLLEQTERNLELEKLENKQQLANFENKALLQDIESKNRELAISTMSLIKKNEFLGDIKEELKSINSNKDLSSVIKIIDKNINNNNDWELFEEAFNNADKDFLKKVKSKHPSLTSNDLRLCAYLRLNLSSKEIAPLLNISVRSVEVKRYRLRKKMDLEHNMGLTDYILEL